MINPTGRVFIVNQTISFALIDSFVMSDFYLEAKVDLFNENLTDSTCLLMYSDNCLALYVPIENFTLRSLFLPITSN